MLFIGPYPARSDLESDDPVGLIFLNNRYYDPTTATFLSVDPLVQTTFEPYVYGAANPIRFSDPSGLEVCDIATGICWDDYEDFTRGSVYAKTRGAYAEAGVRPKVTYDPGSNTTIYENIPAALQGVLTEKEGVAWNTGASGGALGYQFFNGIKSHNSGNGIEIGDFTFGVNSGFCIFFCLEVGVSGEGPYVRLGIGFAYDSPALVLSPDNPDCGTERTVAYVSASAGPAQGNVGGQSPGGSSDWNTFSQFNVGLPNGGAIPSYGKFRLS